MDARTPKIHLDPQNGILSVEGENFLNMSPDEINAVVRNYGTFNYAPIPGISPVGPGQNGYTLAVNMNTPSGFEERAVIDAHACYSANSFGHNNREIIQKFDDFLKKQFLVHAQTSTPHNAAFLMAMALFSGMEKVFPKVAGTEGPDTAIDAACRYWKKQHPRFTHNPIIVAAHHCFHGRTETARRLYEHKDVQYFGDEGDYSQIIKIPFGDTEILRKTLLKYQYQIAAFIVEPIQGEGGVHVPPDDYLPAVVRLCQEWDVVSIFDEVQTGFGRAGWPFYFQKYGDRANPDIVCFGKAAGAGVVPLSGIAGASRVLGCFEPGTQGSTWGRTPGISYMGLVAIQYLSGHNLCFESRKKGAHLKNRLLCLQKKYPDDIKEIRGEGLVIGMELTKKHNPTEFIRRLLFEGFVLSGEARGAIRIIPPLVISYEGIDAIVNSIELVLRS